ncbi:MAG: LPD38 domain-containing protein [Bermanella sp.]
MNELPAGFEVLPEGFEVEPVSAGGLPAGFEVLPEGFEIEQPETLQQEQSPSMLDLVSEKLAVPNVVKGAGERAGDIAGGMLSSVNAAARSGQKALPMGGLVWDGGILPSYKNAEEYQAYQQEGGTDLLQEAEASAKDFDIGYVPTHTWEAVKKEFSENGALSASAWGEVTAYIGEQGVKSIPDMAAVLLNLPSYIVARSGEIGDTRAKNKGKEQTDLIDVVEAAPFAIGSALLERIGAKGITQAGAENFGKEALKAGFKEATKRTAKAGGKAATKEALTEAVQEGIIEYSGERFGTDAKMSVAEALDQGLAGAVAGGGTGAALGSGSAAIKEATYNPQAELGRALNKFIDNARLEVHPEETMDALAPQQAINPEVIQAEALPSLSVEIENVQPQPFTVETEEKGKEPAAEEKPQQGKIKGLAVVEAPTSEIVLSEDVPQFKDGSDKEGVVEPLGGKFERTGVAPIQIWVREDGRKEVISGRHRLDLAKRSGEVTIPAQYHYEEKGFNIEQASALDAILNIREGQGKVKDYVTFIQATNPTEQEAQSQGILARATGQRAFTIADSGSDTLIASHRADRLSDEAATRIAKAAPNNDALQAVGMQAIENGKTITMAENLVKAVDSMTDESQTQSGDLFGFDDSAMKEAVELAKKVGRKQAEIQRTLTAVTGAAKNPELAAKEGVNVKDPEAIIARVKLLKSKKKAWDNWHTNPRLMAELKGKPKLELAQETEADIAKREADETKAKAEQATEQKAIEDKAQADKEAGDFVLAGSDLEADQAEARGQDVLFSKSPIKNTRTQEVAGDGIQYSRTFTPSQKRELMPVNEQHQPLSETQTLEAVSNLTNDGPMPNNPPMFAELEQTDSMPKREASFELRGKTIKLESKYNPQNREAIFTHVKDIIGNRLYINRIKKKNVGGYYNTVNGETRLKKYGDIEVLAHEMAHYLDFYHEFKALKNGKQYRRTLGKNDRIETAISKLYSKIKNMKEVASFSYTSNEKLVYSEGFAEYLRAWLTNYDFAKERAPNFTKDFEALLEQDKRFGNKLFSLQIKMHKWFKQGDSGRLVGVTSGETDINKSLTAGERIMRLRSREVLAESKQELIDHLHAAKFMSRTVKGKLDNGVNEPYKLLQLLNGSEQIFAESYYRGAPYYKADGSLGFHGISLENVWGKSKRAGHNRMKDQEVYFAARRAQEATRKGTEKLFTPGMIREGLALAEEHPYFKKAFSDYQKHNKTMLQFYVDSGYISKDSMNAFLKNNQAYVAFHRAIDTRSNEGKGSGSNIGARQSGSEESIQHIYKNTLKQTGIHIAAALKARAMRKLYMQTLPVQKDNGSFDDVNNAGALFLTKATTDVKRIAADVEQVADTILQKGTENETKVGDLELDHNGEIITSRAQFIDYLNDNPDLLKFWAFGQPPKDKRSDFDSFIDHSGQTQWVQINEDGKLLPSMLEALGGLQLPNDKLSKSIAKIPLIVKNIKTVTITSAWQFAGGNLIRDSFTAMTLTGFKFKPVYHHAIAMGYMVESLWNKNGLVGELRGNGGYSGGRMQSTMYDNWGITGSNTKYISDTDWYKSPTRIFTEMLFAYTKLADVAEMATRVGYYYSERKSGTDPVEAAWKTRELTTDFQKHGAKPILAYAVRTVPFLNAGLQGLNRELEALFEVNGEMKLNNLLKDENGRLTLRSAKTKMYGTMMMVAGLSMVSAYLMLTSDDENERDLYQNLTSDERARFIYLPGGTRLPKPNGPMGFAMGMAEIAVNSHLGVYQGELGKEFLQDDALFAMGHHLIIKGWPAIAQLPVDMLSGTDWKDAPIVPYRLKNVTGDYSFEQYNSRTGLVYMDFSKELKDKFNISLSPIKTEYVVKSASGYYSEYMSEYTDRLFWDYENWGERPFQKSFTDISFRQFKKDPRVFRNRYTGKFYDLLNEATQVEAAFKASIEHHAMNGSESYKENFGQYEHTMGALKKSMQGLNKSYSDWGKGVVIDSHNPDLSAKQKEQREIKRLNSRNKELEQHVTQVMQVIKQAKNDIKKLERK